MRFPPSFLEEIRARISISSVVARAVQWDRRKTNAGKGDYWAGTSMSSPYIAGLCAVLISDARARHPGVSIRSRDVRRGV